MAIWDDEPNELEFEHAGLSCLILRHRTMGHLSGYVCVPKGHRLYGEIGHDLRDLDVHGGVTCCGYLKPGGLWCIGFDCAHPGDAIPWPEPYPERPGVYRDIHYVRRECERLADQLAAHAKEDERCEVPQEKP